MCQYAGKVLLVVNTASYCGFTPQYEGLETLHATIRCARAGGDGLSVERFRSAGAGRQAQIADLCFNTYGVKFPMFAKTVVVGKEAHPLFVSLAQATGQAPGWNFHKYLVDRQGRPVAAFASKSNPPMRRWWPRSRRRWRSHEPERLIGAAMRGAGQRLNEALAPGRFWS